MSEFIYRAETNSFEEQTAPELTPVTAPAPAARATFKASSATKTPRLPRAEKEQARARAAQAWNIAEKHRLAAAGAYIVHNCSFFKKEDVAELGEMGLRLATDHDPKTQIMFIENVEGHLREVRVCALEKPTAPRARARVRDSHGVESQTVASAPAQLADLNIAGDPAQNSARATTISRPPASGPSAHPA